jgi:hypothetical protein
MNAEAPRATTPSSSQAAKRMRLAKAGEIESTWGGGNRKPHDDDIIRLKVKTR